MAADRPERSSNPAKQPDALDSELRPKNENSYPFARYRYREALFPTLVFRRAYDALSEKLGSRADVEYVRILLLAASESERAVEAALDQLLASEQLRDYAQVRATVQPQPIEVPRCEIPEPDLGSYDELTAAGGQP